MGWRDGSASTSKIPLSLISVTVEALTSQNSSKLDKCYHRHHSHRRHFNTLRLQ